MILLTINMLLSRKLCAKGHKLALLRSKITQTTYLQTGQMKSEASVGITNKLIQLAQI